MKKRKIVIIIGMVLAVLVIGVVVCMRIGVFNALLPRKELVLDEQQSQINMNMNAGLAVAEGRELIALINSEEQAEEVANQYGIELIEVEAGVAVFTTDQPLDEVIRKGETEGYLPLSINYIRNY